ncbi:cysteine hydrolase family protein [Paraburkholderia sp. EG287B]|uniref:cysteine hydrolase family protein n=1 Tax=Paraburkholderia sp. EG287B TaxID=3237010 RepID=UPI0034D38571
MADRLALDLPKTALLLMDMQTVAFEKYVPTVRSAELLENTAKLLASARAAAIKVVYVTVGFRRNYPEIDPRNALFTSIKEEGLFALEDIKTAIHPAVRPAAGDPVVIKHRVGAFSGTDLQMLLSANGIETLLIAGVTTSGSVLSTLRQAFDLDYRLIVARDCCADLDDDVHQMLMDKLFPPHAEVVLSTDISNALSA